jgi:hypothetical protein
MTLYGARVFVRAAWASQRCHVDSAICRCRHTSSSSWPPPRSLLPSAGGVTFQNTGTRWWSSAVAATMLEARAENHLVRQGISGAERWSSRPQSRSDTTFERLRRLARPVQTAHRHARGTGVYATRHDRSQRYMMFYDKRYMMLEVPRQLSHLGPLIVNTQQGGSSVDRRPPE